MVHSHTVHLPLGALLSPCTMCGTGQNALHLRTLRQLLADEGLVVEHAPPLKPDARL